MSAAKAKPRKKSSTSTSTRKGAAAASGKAVAASAQRIGRGTRWTEAQVKLLFDTVDSSGTAKEAFEIVARELGKSAGTVAQKYYNIQRAATGSAKRSTGAKRGRPKGSTTRAAVATTGGIPSASTLRVLSVDDLVGLASRVKDEIDRRRTELDAAARALKS